MPDLNGCQSVSIALHLRKRGALSFQFEDVTEASAVGSVGDFFVCTVGNKEQRSCLRSIELATGPSV